MCTQQLIWCSCGHGEFLPIEKCPNAEATGTCWIAIHGDHNVVVPMSCSYCNLGFSKECALGSAKPAAAILPMEESELGVEVEQIPHMDFAPDDVLSTDFTDFNLDDELWQYV